MKLPTLKDLNREEMLVGFIFGLAFAIKIGWWASILAPVTSFMWASGGAQNGGNKLYRRAGCAILPTLAVYAVVHNWTAWWAFLAVPLAFGTLSFGYGMPDGTDKGSIIGRFWTRAFEPNAELANVFTRLTIYVTLILAFIPCWILK